LSPAPGLPTVSLPAVPPPLAATLQHRARVLIVSCPSGDPRPKPCLGPAYLAAVLRRAGHEAWVLDADSLSDTDTAVKETVRTASDVSPHLLGLAVHSPECYPGAMRTLTALLQAGFDGPVLVGGHPPSLRPAVPLSWGATAVVRGEGEATFLEAVESVLDGKLLSDIAGLALPADGPADGPKPLVRFTGRREPVNLAGLPWPVRDYLPTTRPRVESVLACVSASRGCWGNCAFCAVACFYRLGPGPRWRPRPPKDVAAEVAWLRRTFGTEMIHFVDDNFLGAGRQGRDWAREVARAILRYVGAIGHGEGAPRLKIACRVDGVEPETFRLLKRAGLTTVELGVESAYQPTLDRFGKSMRVEDVWRGVRCLLGLGLRVKVSLIMFHPWTTPAEVSANLDLLHLLRDAGQPLGPEALSNRLHVYPGTPLGTQLPPGVPPLPPEVEDVYREVCRLVSPGEAAEPDKGRRPDWESDVLELLGNYARGSGRGREV